MGWLILPLERCQSHRASCDWNHSSHSFHPMGIPDDSWIKYGESISIPEGHDPIEAPLYEECGNFDLYQLHHWNG